MMIVSVNARFKFNGKTHSGISTRGISKRYPSQSQLTIHIGQYQNEIFEEGRVFSSSINDIYGGGMTFTTANHGGGMTFNDTHGGGLTFNDTHGGGLTFNDTHGGGLTFNDTHGGGLTFNDTHGGGLTF